MSTSTLRILHPQVHRFRGTAAYLVEALCIALAVLFPTAAHALGLPVFALLPMHWTILLAALVYGWKAGLLAGATAPLLSFALTGMPFPALLPLITVELGIYGLCAGLLAQKSRINAFLSLVITLIAGRIGFTLMALLLGRIQEGLGPFLQASFAAGLPAAGLQVLLLPVAAAALSGALGGERQH
jgi:niacin transporter